MRRRSILLALPAGLVTLAGCGDDSSDKGKSGKSSPSGDASSAAPSAPPSPKLVEGPLPAITAGGKFGEKPTLAKSSGDPSKDLAVKTVIAGNGATIAENDYLQAHYLGQIWASGKVFDNTFDRKAPILMQLKQGATLEGWRYALAGKKAGSRVEMAIPPAYGFAEQGNPQFGIKASDTMVFVFDVQATFNAKSSAKGKVVAQNDSAVPKVGTNTDGKAPSIEIPDGDAPTKLVAEYVIEGDGPELKATDTVLVQYKGVLWEGGKEFDSTYKRSDLTSFSLQQVVKGWSQGLTGKKVGSRVLVVVPPKLGYGDNPPSGSDIKKDSTLVFTVDILAKS
ncbi:FKBP-type peptidyl-prolyl cis-trans isomerase [Streptomyces cavernae]|uniref:FKBP-type peptidyl-prolyl cis-trans isomerase n=1 Tax=Streptomyces cavernae TaxID=2259034 RepID=UPI000FEB7ABC|nr:FKBP-type peptidyl-prolyl cis-trans isomerase [Streptomyces cavernae]